MDCPRCGARVQQGMQYCSVCGVLVGTSTPPPAQQYPQQVYPPQPYPYQYPPPQPYAQLKEGISAIGKVIIALVVGAMILVVIGIVLITLLIGSIDDNVGPSPPTIQVQPPIVHNRQVGGDTHWDAITIVATVSSEGAGTPWSNVRYVLRSSGGDVLLEGTAPLPDNASMYDDGSDGSVDIQAWYVDIDGDGMLGPVDLLKLTGLTLASQGGEWEVVRVGERMVQTELPANFL